MKDRTRIILKILLVILGVLLVFLVIFLVRECRRIKRYEVTVYNSGGMTSFPNHRSMSVVDAYTLKSWMTFDYINTAFRLSPEYLKNRLGLNSTQYPRITIGRYAKQHRQDSQALLVSVKDAIVSYFAQSQI